MDCKECNQLLIPSEEEGGICHECEDKKYFNDAKNNISTFLEGLGDEGHYNYIKQTKERWPIIEKGNGFTRAKSLFFSDTPKSLYRFLYLWEPKSVDFSDMYKSEWLALINLDGKATVGICLHRYELSAYLYLPDKDFVEHDNGIISSGIPGTEDVMISESSQGMEEFSKFIGLLEMKHDVYPGDNFSV